ncbi:MAG: DUF4851 domain-containing protein [Desulfovibrionaceae bacterium]|nr:DUF4851 domain-containing protein [Desulfovibrionaceae bacterium]
MTKMIMVVAVAALLIAAACAGMHGPLMRGVARAPGSLTQGVLSSNTRPAAAVVPAAGFLPVAHGATSVGVPFNASLTATASARVWYALHADTARQLVASLAEVEGALQWSLNPSMIDRLGLRVFHEGRVSLSGAEMLTYTYVRPAARDPWMRPFADHGKGWDGDVLLRQYTWWIVGDQTKVMVEYREPVPAGTDLEYDRMALGAFNQRADAAFTLLRGERGDEFPLEISYVREDEARVNQRQLAGVLGEAMSRAHRFSDDW